MDQAGRAFPDASFDVIVNPVSNVFCPELGPVWRESSRVLRPGGVLMIGFMNPDIFVFDVAALDERGEFVVRHPLPFSSLDLPADERARAYGDGGLIEYSHTLTEQIGARPDAGLPAGAHPVFLHRGHRRPRPRLPAGRDRRGRL